jgi:hypothetical protein
MVAPLDAKASFEVEGETITLRLNFRALALAKKEGVNLMSGENMDAISLAIAVRCLAAQDHPQMTDEEAFAIVVRGGEASAAALVELFSAFGASAEGNAAKKGN